MTEENYAFFENAINRFGDRSKPILMSGYHWDEKMFNDIEKKYYEIKMRDKVVRTYGKCVLSDEKKLTCLDVVHIKPICECKRREKESYNNVLLMWTDLRKYFERYDFTIHPETFRGVIFDECPDHEWLADNIYEYIYLQKKSIKYIKYHYNKFCELHPNFIYTNLE